jgi:translation initiation factor IF-3
MNCTYCDPFRELRDQTWRMSKVEQMPRMENRQMVMVLTPR